MKVLKRAIVDNTIEGDDREGKNDSSLENIGCNLESIGEMPCKLFDLDLPLNESNHSNKYEKDLLKLLNFVKT